MKHWNDIKCQWNDDTMTEHLLYKVSPARHIDTNKLFKPNKNMKHVFVIKHNLVDGEISDNGSFINGTHTKNFCIHQEASDAKTCKGKEKDLNEHYTCKSGTILIFAKDACYYCPHKAEIQNKMWTCVTMSRDYNIIKS